MTHSIARHWYLLGCCTCWTLTSCALESGSAQEEQTDSVGQEVKNGFPVNNPDDFAAVRITTNGGACSGTLLDPKWVVTAGHCLATLDPSSLSVQMGSQTSSVGYATLHPRSAAVSASDTPHSVDVAMLRLRTRFSRNGRFDHMATISPFDTDFVIGRTLTCLGYGLVGGSCTVSTDCSGGAICSSGRCLAPATSPRFAFLSAIVDPDNADNFFQLSVPNFFGQMLLPGDSGSGCWMDFGIPMLVSVHKAGNSTNYNRVTSSEAWSTWAARTLACPNFVPGRLEEHRCTADCPCGPYEGDCNNNAQCAPGLVCGFNIGAAIGAPDDFDVCKGTAAPVKVDDTVLPYFFCPTFDASSPKKSFCTPECPCTIGEGDCDTDDDCRTFLECAKGVGSRFGLPASFDVCVLPQSGL